MYNQIFTLILFAIVTAFTPGPNNISAAYSGFNFGFKKTIPLYKCFRGAKIDFDLLIFPLEIILLIHFYLEHLLRQLKPGYQDVLQF